MKTAGRRRMNSVRGAIALAALIGLIASPAGAEQIVSAGYADPVARYGHYALGRPHEYARVLVTTDGGRELALDLPADEVFEDLAPRLVRLQAGAPAQLLAIVSTRGSGSRLALIGLKGGRLEIVASAAPIGTPNRWLNPVGVVDLDDDGMAEIAAVTTPHIAGVLRLYRQRGERLVEVDSLAGFSNHVYGSAELGLSTSASIDGRMHLLVPDTQRATVRAITLRKGKLVETGHCPLAAPITDPAALQTCAERLSANGPGARR
jgi:hypothetical protein